MSISVHELLNISSVPPGWKIFKHAHNGSVRYELMNTQSMTNTNVRKSESEAKKLLKEILEDSYFLESYPVYDFQICRNPEENKAEDWPSGLTSIYVNLTGDDLIYFVLKYVGVEE